MVKVVRLTITIRDEWNLDHINTAWLKEIILTMGDLNLTTRYCFTKNKIYSKIQSLELTLFWLHVNTRWCAKRGLFLVRLTMKINWPHGQVKVETALENETVWMSQKQMAELFGKAKSYNVFSEGEIVEGDLMKKFGISEFLNEPFSAHFRWSPWPWRLTTSLSLTTNCSLFIKLFPIS